MSSEKTQGVLMFFFKLIGKNDTITVFATS